MDDVLPADEADSRSLLDVLEDALPIKRQLNIDGWPRTPWIWRLELPQIIDLQRKRSLAAEDERGAVEWGIELLVLCLGDENAPGTFASARGRSWLRRQAEALGMLVPLAIEFNELKGAHPDRKKKSESVTAHEPSSTSPPELA